MSQFEVKLVPIESLHFDPSNARLHPDRNLDAISASLATFGQVEPLIVQKGTGRVISGNGRMEVMRKRGDKECWIKEVDIDDTQAVALGIALNRTAELATWDDETLASLLQSLPQECQIAAGFDPDELNELLSKLTPEVVEDVTPEPPASPVSRLGDLWLCGEHRILCGDSTKGEDVGRLMGGEKADLCFTSPPYNAGNSKTGAYGGGSAKRTDFKKMYAHELDDMSSDEYKTFLFSVLDRTAEILCDSACVLWNVSYNATSRREYGEIAFGHKDLKVQETIVWDKGVGMNVCANNAYSRSAEVVFLLSKSDKYKSNQNGGVYWNIWRISPRDGDNMQNGHGASFPVALPSQGIEQHSREGETVYEPFCGSGTTLIAAEQLGRKCYGLEISPQYVDVIVNRWQNLTGKQATLESTGRTFAEVKEERANA